MQAGVLFYPAREFTFQHVAGVSRDFEHIRLGVLSKIINEEYTAIVCSVNAATQLTMPPQELKKRTIVIKSGAQIDFDSLVSRLVFAGYSRYEQVDGTSQFAVRGGIIDIFPPGASEPVRIELWGDMVDSISSFDISTQRRTGNLSEIELIPATEVLFESNEKFIKKLRALAESLKGKAIKAREGIYADIDSLESGVSLPCCDKYMPLAYESSGIFDYLSGLLFLFAKAQRLRSAAKTPKGLCWSR
ncbi:MAG: hypothetical protein L6V88_10935 [Anaerotruncus sp.]|nr:MAG: hypothetical protein L6V88_10935 [Anaerotruncus sp.]